jgi:uncharacterized protein with PIN domain
MSRIGKAYESRFRALLLRLHARKLESGIAWLMNRQPTKSVPATSTAKQLSDRYEHLRTQVQTWALRTHRTIASNETTPRFLCDAGLGGLSRWLRAAGYEAIWFPDIDDAEVLRRAAQLHATLLTTDSLMMERGVLRDGFIPALWVPPTFKKQEQLALVLREFNLGTHEPRCMKCGGELHPVEKESVRDRIPPRTLRWIDEYFACSQCGQLFWKGTHWQKIRETFERLKVG